MSRKIKLVKFRRQHITSQYIGWLNDSELVQYSEQRHHKHTYETCIEYYKSFIGSPNLFYAVIDAESNEHVGNINAIIDTYNSVADIGILIAKGNHGYGFAAWSIMIEILFNEKKVRKITAGTMVINDPMIKIFKKSNMKEEYRKKRQFMVERKEIDLIGYCIFNSCSN